ncbi:uncharacterized protein [Nicotiana tomentosiformis]|uniref:uncharacterized protein n=1 Tax=Nicotiana tomentosiformis TaxID=4098 RepID=UPI00388C6F8C
MKKTLEEIVTILNKLSEDANQWPSEIAERRRSNGLHQVDANISVQVQLDVMAKEIRKLALASIQCEPHAACDICERGHPAHECQASIEEVNVVGNYNFNAMGQVAPSFHNQSGPQFQHQHSTQHELEDLMKSFIVKTYERLDSHGAVIKYLGTGLRKMEKQVGQIVTILSERILGNFPADNDRNPKETVVPKKESEGQLKNEVDKKKKGKKGAKKKKKGETSRREESNESDHMPALPFPLKLYREILDKKFERFLDMLKQVDVNLLFTEVLSQMSAYAKFLKEILTKKRNIEDTSVVKLTEHCSANLGKQTPIKVKLENKLGQIRSALISLQLADQRTIIPEGIVEDVLVRVEKFVFPVDLIVVKMEENKKVTLILGRLFLETCRAILDIHDRKLMVRVGEETVTFEMNVETGVRKEKPAASVKWKVKSSKEKDATSGKETRGCTHTKKDEKKLSAWMCALVRTRRMETDFDSDPD